MNGEKMHIEKNTIQETLVIPLWGRKYCTEIYPTIYQDTGAEKIMEQLDYDYSALEAKKNKTGFRFGYLEAAVRYSDIGMEVQAYLKKHPGAVVVNLGCGLDCSAENNASATSKIYNIDCPDVITVRNQLIPPSDRVTNIGTDLNDTAWFDAIDDSNGVVFLAAGVFYYFLADEIKKLFTAMAERFHGGKLIFDTANRMAVKMMLKIWVKTAGITDVDKYFYINDLEKDLQAWLPGTRVTAKGYMLGYHDLKEDSVSGLFRLMSRIGDGMMKMRIVCIAF